MRMYVSNLSFHTNDEALRTLFSAYGTVNSAKVVTDREFSMSRGFGFVQMDAVGEGEAAMSGLNNKEFQGRTLAINITRENTTLKKSNYIF